MADLPTDRNFWADLLNRVRRRTGGGEDSEDLLHSAFLRLDRYRTQHTVENPRGFLVQTAVNIAIDNHRRERHRDAFDPVETGERPDDAPLQDEVLAARARLTRVREGLGLLPARTREIFLMHRIQGLKYREIAGRVGISASAVEKHIAKAALFLTEWTQDW